MTRYIVVQCDWCGAVEREDVVSSWLHVETVGILAATPGTRKAEFCTDRCLRNYLEFRSAGKDP